MLLLRKQLHASDIETAFDQGHVDAKVPYGVERKSMKTRLQRYSTGLQEQVRRHGATDEVLQLLKNVVKGSSLYNFLQLYQDQELNAGDVPGEGSITFGSLLGWLNCNSGTVFYRQGSKESHQQTLSFDTHAGLLVKAMMQLTGSIPVYNWLLGREDFIVDPVEGIV